MSSRGLHSRLYSRERIVRCLCIFWEVRCLVWGPSGNLLQLTVRSIFHRRVLDIREQAQMLVDVTLLLSPSPNSSQSLLTYTLLMKARSGTPSIRSTWICYLYPSSIERTCPSSCSGYLARWMMRYW